MKGAARKQQPKKNPQNKMVLRGQQLAVKGQGTYTLKEIAHKVLSMVPRGTFQAVGGALGGALGGPKGAALGSQAGRGLSIATGYGDYILNDIVHQAGGVPRMDPNTARTISHCEFVFDVKAPAIPELFNIQQTLALNPGDVTAFPWLAPIAQRFAKFKFRQLIFEFRSSSSDYSSGTALGTVVLAPNYNPIAPPPGTKTAMESLSGAVSAKPSNGIYAGIECAAPNPVRWVRNPSVNTVSQLTDLADFYIATSGLSANAGTTLGELWVHYTVDLYEPYFAPSLSLANPGSAIRIFPNGVGNNLYHLNGWGNLGAAANVTFEDVSGAMAAFCGTTNGVPSTNRSYVFLIDSSRTNNDTIWFGRPGVYLLSSFGANNPTAFTSATGDAYTFSLNDPASSCVRIASDISSGGFSSINVNFLVTIVSPNTSLTTVFNTAGWSSAGAAPRANMRNYITVCL